ncbi:DUF1120 domain-containing protein [[Erwinia] mediterraneensis]|uniref:DUF1120 domain-containing protein n=1 Tax=[Erwinia] mediterraneensis TaxID=2161819 RepID=UPI001031A89F|nr:DUF1120 domain-containing protein [[Erwinia] mediterraneensis]
MSVKIPGKIAGLCLLAASAQFSAQAQDRAHLYIMGSVIPSACELSITNANVDFTGLTVGGFQDHSGYGVYTAREKNVPFNITCNGPTRVALSAQADKMPTTGLAAFPTYDSPGSERTQKANEQISLAVDAQAKDIAVGTIMLKSSEIRLDENTPESILTSTDNQATWTAAKKIIMRQDNSGFYSWGTPVKPEAAKNISGSLIINVNIDHEAVDRMENSLTFSGGTTLILHYL